MKRLPTDFDELPPLDGRLSQDEGARAAYAQDYGQIVHKRPLAVLLPGSLEDIVRIVRFARRQGLKIAPRGHGHQPFGQTQVEGGIVIDLRALHSVHSVSADRMEVDAGADWRTAVQAAMPQGSAPPVLTNYLGLTVGGTLSVGGIGVTTFRHGAQVDNVLELTVVTGDGEMIRCSKSQHSDLFEAALAGQGQCAIIVRAVLRLVPAKLMTREYALHYADVATLLEDELSLTQNDRFDGAVALIIPSARGWSFMLTAIRQFTPPELPDDARLTADLRPIAGSQQTRDVSHLEHLDAISEIPPGSHADLGQFIPGSKAARFIADILPRLTPDDLGAVAGMRVFFLKRGPFAQPLLRIPNEETFVYLAMLRSPTNDPNAVTRMLAGNRTLFEQNRALGGTVYPFCALELSPDDWRRQYGDAGRGLEQAKRRYDPGNVFATTAV